MLPVVTIIGRPNVGKSTLFNRLTNTKDALVVDLPGTTRDRNYGIGNIGNQQYILIDTPGVDNQIDHKDPITSQVKKAIIDSQIILFIVDASAGIMAGDLDLSKRLRKFSKKVILVVNKIDGVNTNLALDFFKLGFNNVVQISAKANRGINNLINELINYSDSELFLDIDNTKNLSHIDFGLEESIKVAIVGQPNVGKSTLINTILGEERVVVFDNPGTTRDSISISTIFGKHKYTLIDTAGVRKKGKVKETLEKFSIIKTMESIKKASVVILLIEAKKGLVEQDFKLIDFIFKSGRSLVFAINKWDTINKIDQKKLLLNIKKDLIPIDFVNPTPIVAVKGTGIKKLFKEIILAFKSANLAVSTNKLNLLLQEAIASNQLPLSKGRRIKLRYAHLGGYLPFRIIVHGTQAESLPDHYKKYLSNFFRQALQLYGTVVHIILKNSKNPYV